MPARWWCGAVRVCYSPEVSVVAEKEGGWWADIGIQLDRLRRCIRDDGKECD